MTQHSSEREQELDEKQIDYHQWTEHCIDGKIVLPPSQVLIYVWKVYLESFALDFKQQSVIIEDMIMSKQVVVQPYSQQLTMTLRRGTNSFGVLLKEKDVLGETFLTGKLRTIPKPTIDLPTEEEYEDHGERAEILKEEIMSVLTYFGYELGKEFQTFKHMILKNKGPMKIIDQTKQLDLYPRPEEIYEPFQQTNMKWKEKWFSFKLLTQKYPKPELKGPINAPDISQVTQTVK